VHSAAEPARGGVVGEQAVRGEGPTTAPVRVLVAVGVAPERRRLRAAPWGGAVKAPEDDPRRRGRRADGVGEFDRAAHGRNGRRQ